MTAAFMINGELLGTWRAPCTSYPLVTINSDRIEVSKGSLRDDALLGLYPVWQMLSAMTPLQSYQERGC